MCVKPLCGSSVKLQSVKTHLIPVKFIWNSGGSLKVKCSLSSYIIPEPFLILSFFPAVEGQSEAEDLCLKESSWSSVCVGAILPLARCFVRGTDGWYGMTLWITIWGRFQPPFAHFLTKLQCYSLLASYTQLHLIFRLHHPLFLLLPPPLSPPLILSDSEQVKWITFIPQYFKYSGKTRPKNVRSNKCMYSLKI